MPGGVKPDEEGLVLFRGALDELLGAIQKLQIDRFHACIERTGVGHAPSAKLWTTPGAGRSRKAESAGSQDLQVFLSIEVIEVEELIKPVLGDRNSSRSPRWFLPNCPVA